MKKRWIAVLLCAVLLLGLAGAMAEDAMVPDHATGFGVYKYVYTRNGKPLHMRAQPSREAAVLLDIPYGGRVLYVYEENITWAYVQYGSTAGFVMQEYLVDYQPASPTPSGGGSSLPPSTTGSLAPSIRSLKPCGWCGGSIPSIPAPCAPAASSTCASRLTRRRPSPPSAMTVTRSR